MAATNRAGIWFQDLTAIIERAFVGDPNTTVEGPGWLPVLSTGDQREFDVLITRRQDHHTTRTAIECKDWNTAVDVQEVESFITKYRRCGVHRAIMVSRLGFSKGAREAAAESSIDCMTLAPAGPDDLRVAVDLRHRKVHFRGVYYSIRNAANVVEPYEPFAASGQPITKQDLADLATQNAPDPDEVELTNGTQNYRVEFPSAGGIYLIDAMGNRYDPTKIILDMSCTFDAEPVSIESYVYEGGDKRYVISITRDMDAGQVKGRMIMIDDEAGMRAAFVPLPVH
jgi:hypothetical protein